MRPGIRAGRTASTMASNGRRLCSSAPIIASRARATRSAKVGSSSQATGTGRVLVYMPTLPSGDRSSRMSQPTPTSGAARAGVAREHRAPRGEQEHRRRGAEFARPPVEEVERRRVEGEHASGHHALRRVGRDRRGRRRFDGRERGSPPVRETLAFRSLEQGAFAADVGVEDFRTLGRRRRRFAAVSLRQLALDAPPGTAIRDRVVDAKAEQVARRVNAPEARAHQRTGLEVERLPHEGAQALVGFAGVRRQVEPLQPRLARRVHVPHRLAGHGDERRAERRVPRDERVERDGQPVGVERALEAPRERRVVRRVRGVALRDPPEAGLGR